MKNESLVDTLYRDYPADAPCCVSNPLLWAKFAVAYFAISEVYPFNPAWAEADVVTWLDERNQLLDVGI